jgi:hypothetical protein
MNRPFVFNPPFLFMLMAEPAMVTNHHYGILLNDSFSTFTDRIVLYDFCRNFFITAGPKKDNILSTKMVPDRGRAINVLQSLPESTKD